MARSSSAKSNRPMRVVKLMLDDGKRMIEGTPLDIDGDVLLITSGQEVEQGTRLRLVPIVDDQRRTALLDFHAEVENTFVDVLVSAFDDNRFILTLRVPDEGTLLRDLEALVSEARACRRAPRRRKQQHVSGLIASGFWAEQSA